MKFILIMIVVYSSRTATVTAEFDDYASCEKARKHIASNFDRGTSDRFGVLTHGCHPKGQK